MILEPPAQTDLDQPPPIEPYRSELGPLWRCHSPEAARRSSRAILEAYGRYKANRDFVGMDMARRYLQMGWRRGRRHDATGQTTEASLEANRTATVFLNAYRHVVGDPVYQMLRGRYLDRHGRRAASPPRPPAERRTQPQR